MATKNKTLIKMNPSKKGSSSRSKNVASTNQSSVQTAPVNQGMLMGFRGSSQSMSRRVKGRELIGEVYGTNSNDPVVATYFINPGLTASFPRLSKEARVWEQYRVHSFQVSYLSAVGSTQAGIIILSPDYDPSDPEPTSEQQLANTEGARVGYPWAPFSIPLDVKAMHALGPRKFIREGPVPGDIKTFDVCMLSVAAVANQNASSLGRLWFEYDIEFFVPCLDLDLPTVTTCSGWRLQGSQILTANVSTTVSFNALEHGMHGNVASGPLGIKMAGGEFTLPRGCFLVFAGIGYTTNANSGQVQVDLKTSDLNQASVSYGTGVGSNSIYLHNVVVSTGSLIVSVKVYPQVGATLLPESSRIIFYPI